MTPEAVEYRVVIGEEQAVALCEQRAGAAASVTQIGANFCDKVVGYLRPQAPLALRQVRLSRTCREPRAFPVSPLAKNTLRRPKKPGLALTINMAFSGEVDSGSREENASNKRLAIWS